MATRAYLCGAHVWALWSLTGIPRYELFDYQKETTGRHLFKSRSRSIMMICTTEQLEENLLHFKPFCIDTERASNIEEKTSAN